MTRARFATLVLLAALPIVPHARGASIVVPGSADGVEGDQGNLFPFSDGSVPGISSQRYQQVYGASAFSSASGPLLITDIFFRPDATLLGAPFSTTIPSIQINLSTTSAPVDGLSFTFADNVGANDTIVFNGALTLSTAYTGPSGGPKDFDISIHLSTPFTYDPAAGNLLLDVRNFGASVTDRFDTAGDLNDSVSRVYTSNDGRDVNSSTATFTGTEGLVTRFDFTPAPATPLPAAAWAAAPLIALLPLARRRRLQ
jgi:hypothetical protein